MTIFTLLNKEYVTPKGIKQRDRVWSAACTCQRNVRGQSGKRRNSETDVMYAPHREKRVIITELYAYFVPLVKLPCFLKNEAMLIFTRMPLSI